MASAVAWRLFRSHMRRICMLDLPQPLAVRRRVAYCAALDAGRTEVEGVAARRAANASEIRAAWAAQEIAVVTTTDWARIRGLAADVLVDAILAKRNCGTKKSDAPLVIALGPGFEAGRDCHFVVETNRGHDLGRLIEQGSAAPNSGIPGDIAGHTAARVLRSPANGTFQSRHEIGEWVQHGDLIGRVADAEVRASIGGILRGLIRPGTKVAEGVKLGDIDPRAEPEYCGRISDKARAIAGSVLEAIMRRCNTA